MIFSLEAASIRMDTLEEDLLTYSRVSIKPAEETEVDLNYLNEQMLEDLELEI